MKNRLNLNEEAQRYFSQSTFYARKNAIEYARSTKQLKRFLLLVSIIFFFFAYKVAANELGIGIGVVGFISTSFILFSGLSMTLSLVKVSSQEITKSWKKLDALNFSRLNK